MKWGKTEQTYSSFWLLFGWEELCEEAALSPRFPGDCLGDSCSDIEITSSVIHCKMRCAPVQGSCCLWPQAELSEEPGWVWAPGLDHTWEQVLLCSVITPRNVQHLLCQQRVAELTWYQNPNKWWGYIPAAAVFVDSLVLSVISHLWLPHQTLLVQMVLAAGPQLRKWPRKAGGFWGLSSSAKHCLGDVLMVRSSRMGSEFPFSSKLSCFL